MNFSKWTSSILSLSLLTLVGLAHAGDPTCKTRFADPVEVGAKKVSPPSKAQQKLVVTYLDQVINLLPSTFQFPGVRVVRFKDNQYLDSLRVLYLMLPEGDSADAMNLKKMHSFVWTHELGHAVLTEELAKHLPEPIRSTFVDARKKSTRMAELIMTLENMTEPLPNADAIEAEISAIEEDPNFLALERIEALSGPAQEWFADVLGALVDASLTNPSQPKLNTQLFLDYFREREGELVGSNLKFYGRSFDDLTSLPNYAAINKETDLSVHGSLQMLRAQFANAFAKPANRNVTIQRWIQLASETATDTIAAVLKKFPEVRSLDPSSPQFPVVIRFYQETAPKIFASKLKKK